MHITSFANTFPFTYTFPFIFTFRSKDGVALTATDKYRIVVEETTYTLVVLNVQEADLGEYSIKAKSKAGENSAAAQLVITGKKQLIILGILNEL